MHTLLPPMITDERLRLAQASGSHVSVAAVDLAGAGPATISIVNTAGYNGTVKTEVKAGVAAVVAPAVTQPASGTATPAPAPPADEPAVEVKAKKPSAAADA
jgi:hypothetical protein